MSNIVCAEGVTMVKATKKSNQKITKKTIKKSIEKVPPDWGRVGVTDFVKLYDKFPCEFGYNCNLSAARRVLKYLGFDISEAMLLGVGGNLGFIYWNMKMMNTPFIGGFNKFPDSIERPMVNLGGAVQIFQSPSIAKGQDQLRKLLEIQPAWTMVDIAYLPYFWGEYEDKINEEVHFGGHSVVIYGLDEVKGVAYVSDRFEKPFTIKLEYLQRARNAPGLFMKPNNQLVQFTPPKNKLTQNDWKTAVFKGLKINAETMLHPPIKNIGILGMEKMHDLVKSWPTEYKGARLVNCLTETYLYNESGGSGGAMFRRIYVDFLKEAAEKTGLSFLNRAHDIYEDAANAWSQVALDLLPDKFPNLRKIRENILESDRCSVKCDVKRVEELNTEKEKLVKKAAETDSLTFQDHIPQLQKSIQIAHDLEQKAWELIQKNI
jgi:hypothetical protein